MTDLNSMPNLLHYVNFNGNKDYYTAGVKKSGNLCNSNSMRFKLHKFRTDRGFTQSQVAEAIGISQGLYNQLESGKRRMNETYLVSLSELYGIDPIQLIGDETRDDPLFEELDQAFRSLSPIERQIVVDSAKGIAAGRDRKPEGQT